MKRRLPRIFQKKGRSCFAVRIQPRSSSDRVAGLWGDALRVQITAPPIEGRANHSLLDFLAAQLKLPKSRLHIESGVRSRTKTVAVDDLDEAQLSEQLWRLLSRSNRSK